MRTTSLFPDQGFSMPFSFYSLIPPTCCCVAMSKKDAKSFTVFRLKAELFLERLEGDWDRASLKKRGCTVMLGVCTQHVVASTPSSSSSNSQCRRRTSGRLCQDSWSSSDLASWMGTSSPSWRRLSLQFPWSRCLSSGAAAGPAGIEHRFRAAQCFPPLLCFFPIPDLNKRCANTIVDHSYV